MLGVALGVALGVILGVGVGDILIEGVILGLLEGVLVGVRDGEGLDEGDGGGTILAGLLVITIIPCSYIMLPTYSFTSYKLFIYTLPSPSSNKVPLTGLSNLNDPGLM